MFYDKKIGVIVPAYNEEEFVESVLETMPEFVDKIIVVDDGSVDKTSEKVMPFVKKNPDRFILIRQENQGVGGAIITGHKKALEVGMDIMAVMAGDGQMNPVELPRLLEPIIADKADYVKGNRLLRREYRGSMPKIRLIGNSILSIITKFSSGYWNLMDPQNGYTAIRRECLEVLPLDHIRKDFLFENDMLIHLGVYNYRVVDIMMKARYGRESSHIQTLEFIVKAILTLTQRFLWRLTEKYLIQDFHPVFFFYLGGIILTPLGILLGCYMLFVRLKFGFITAGSVLLPTVLVVMGMQFLLFAMLFDRETGKR
jgi:glycosyltransferase involved in cell wall biosynthesis